MCAPGGRGERQGIVAPIPHACTHLHATERGAYIDPSQVVLQSLHIARHPAGEGVPQRVPAVPAECVAARRLASCALFPARSRQTSRSDVCGLRSVQWEVREQLTASI